MSHLEEKLRLQMRALNLEPMQQFRFAAEHTGGTGKGCRQRIKAANMKDWRFDFAWPELLFAVEVEGGLFVNGRHSRGEGFEADLEKYRHAILLGWTVFRCGAKMIKSGVALSTIERILIKRL